MHRDAEQPGLDPPTPESVRARKRYHLSPRRWAEIALYAVAHRDYVMVAFMVVFATLSALSVYQATRADDVADSRLGVLRIVEADAARQSGLLQTVIVHDLRVLTQYCGAESLRHDAMTDLLNGEPNPAKIASATITTRLLKPLLLGDRLAQCASPSQPASYDVARARQSVADIQPKGALPDVPPGQQDVKIATSGTAEQSLMTAGLLFAVALALLITIDLLGRTEDRPRVLGSGQLTALRRSLLVLTALCAVAATLLLAIFTVALPVDAESRYITIGVIALLLVWNALAGRWRVMPHFLRAASSRPQWWAEVIGAGVILVFSLTALGLSSIGAREREASMRADALQSSAQQIQQQGEQTAFRDLAAAATSAQFVEQTAEAATMRLENAEPSASELDEILKIESDFEKQATTFDATVREQVSKSAGKICPAPMQVAEAQPPDPSDRYQELAEAGRSDWLVFNYQEPALACDAATEIARAETRVWARHGSSLTVALVVLGLAGFMLALASASKREVRVSRSLRAAGVLGLATGLVLSGVALPDLVWRAFLPSQEDVPGIAAAIAAEQFYPCREGAAEGTAALDAAIEQFPSYGRAFEVRGSAELSCAQYGDYWRLTSDVRPDAVQASIANYDEARSLGGSGVDLDLSAGWVHLLGGIQTNQESEILEGLRLTDEAIAALEFAYPAQEGTALAGTRLHVARFNRALAFAALDKKHEAEQAYQKAIKCLAPERKCAGGGLLDPELADTIVLWAFADLELFGTPAPDGDPKLDRYRLKLVDPAVLVDPADRKSVHPLRNPSLNIYAQDGQVRAEEPLPSLVTVVWYSRKSEKDSWQVLQVPSHTTMHPGGYLQDRPISLGEFAPEAHYRADVYTGGVRTPVTLEDDTAYVPPEAIRVVTEKLALSAIVPEGWVEDPLLDDGFDWHVGPDSDSDSGLTIRRIEGVVPGEDMSKYLQQTLEGWAEETHGVDASALTPVELGYFLGSSHALVADASDRGLRVAVAYEPYAWEDPLRGGTTFLAALDDPSPVVRAWIEEIVLEAPQQTFPSSVHHGNGFSLEISDAWTVDKSGAPENFLRSATPSPDYLMGLEVYQSADQSGVGKAVDTWVEQLESGETPWTDVEIESRKTVSVPGADDAELLEYSGDSESSQRMWQWDLFASNGKIITNIFVDTLDEDVWNDRSTVEAILDSFELTG